MTDRSELIRQLEKAAADLDGISQEKMGDLLRRAAIELQKDEARMRAVRAGILEVIDAVDQAEDDE